jgi:hypothetical protein
MIARCTIIVRLVLGIDLERNLSNLLFNAHQSFLFQGFCDQVKSGTYPLKHAAAAANVALSH